MGKSGDLFMQIMGRYNDLENHFKMLEEQYYYHKKQQDEHLRNNNSTKASN